MENGMSLLDVLSGNALLQPPTIFLIITVVMLVRKRQEIQCLFDRINGLMNDLPFEKGKNCETL